MIDPLPALAAASSAATIELVIGLLVVVAGVALLAEKLKLPYPILLVMVGMAIAVFPGLPDARLAPEFVFLLFLPPLLYYAGIMTTWRDFVANIRPISLLAVGLVAATSAIIAVTVKLLIPEMPWAAAVVLGAIVSPSDTVAATAICERLAVPRRVTTILEGESLINDATALVLYKLAIAAAMTGVFSFAEIAWKFPLIAVGGVGIGLLAGWVSLLIRRRVHEPAVEGTVALLTPYLAYLPAEWLGCSGVLAAVTSGVFMSRWLPRVLPARARLRDAYVWSTIVFLMNGLVFVLIGLQLPTIATELSHIPVGRLAFWSSVVASVTILVRLAWVYLLSWLPGRIRAALRREQPDMTAGELFIIGWAGMRGIVTLAAAMALPLNFPYRNEIVFLSFALILATLVLQGLSLTPIIRGLGLGDDGSAAREEREARWEATHAALARLEVLGFSEQIPPEVLRRVRESYDERLAALSRAHDRDHAGEKGDAACPIDLYRRVHREALEAERRMITFLRDQNVIGDEALRAVIAEIDMEEAKLA